MNVKEIIKELQEWVDMDERYAETPVYWLNLNTQEHEEVENIEIFANGLGFEIR
jgi:hypothetical protein